MNAAELRRMFLIESLFAAGQLQLLHCFDDRAIVGSAVPLQDRLTLSSSDELRAEYFLQCRELGVLNIGAAGTVTVDGDCYAMENLDCLYIGRGSRSVVFSTSNPQLPAQFYLVSYPAHAAYPSALVKKGSATALPLGLAAACNQRTIYRYIHPGGVQSCQLVMGFTQLADGSVWNTMPPHTHARRTEVYLYFDLQDDARVFHLMGTATETRHIVVADRQAVISPPWSMHSGVGTRRYSFCWAMGGENQIFDDMDPIPVSALR
jgi:4-deoxy-L-threo-5-hexosulose-uronate ketol-isomerase